MMQVRGLENLTPEQLDHEIKRGGKFVQFEYCISLLIVTFKRRSGIYFLRPDDSPVVKGIAYTLISVLLAWWGFPWGPVYTVAALATNFGGGKDVTWDVLNVISGRPTTLN